VGHNSTQSTKKLHKWATIRHKKHRKYARTYCKKIFIQKLFSNRDARLVFFTNESHIAIDLHRPTIDQEIGRNALETVQQWNRKLSVSIEKGVEHFGQKRLSELGQFLDTLIAERGRRHRRWLTEFEFGDPDRTGDVGSVEFRYEITTQYSHIGSAQQLSFLFLTTDRTVDFHEAVAGVEIGTIFGLDDDRWRSLIAFVD